jgi:light-harvesting complex 1 beta chain
MFVNPSLSHAHHPAKGERLAFALVYVPSFVLLLIVAAIGQVLGLSWKSWLPGAENMGNIFSGVSAGIYTFMSHVF